MRVENWKVKEVFSACIDEAINAGNEIMDDVVFAAKCRCPVGEVTKEGKWKSTIVSFVPQTKNRRKIPEHKREKVSFAAMQFTGRTPGTLRETIRKVIHYSRPGNLRVYAGNKKVNYAHFVEYGTVKMRAKSFLRPGFQSIKNQILGRIEKGIGKVPEVQK
jgi:HK97 gp10 family phage protein